MNFKHMTHSRFHSIGGVAQPHVERRKAARAGEQEQGRKTILYGWIISMIGIVTYCFVMLGGDQQADLIDTLAARGAIGWAAMATIGIGVALWFAGCFLLLREADANQDQDGTW